MNIILYVLLGIAIIIAFWLIFPFFSKKIIKYEKDYFTKQLEEYEKEFLKKPKKKISTQNKKTFNDWTINPIPTPEPPKFKCNWCGSENKNPSNMDSSLCEPCWYALMAASF